MNKNGTLKLNKDGKPLTNYEKFNQLRHYFENDTIERLRNGDWRLLTKKGGLPYEYISPDHIILRQNYHHLRIQIKNYR